MAEQLTPWYPPEERPKRIGVYRVFLDDGDECHAWFSFWNSKSFNWLSLTVDGAYAERKLIGAGKAIRKWRGLANKPRGAK